MGSWRGYINTGKAEIPIVFHFFKDSLQQLHTLWDSPSQNVNGLPCSSLSSKGDSVEIGLKVIAGYYAGKFITPDSIAGRWHQNKHSIALNLKKFLDTSKLIISTAYPNEKEISITYSGADKIYGILLSKNNHQRLAIIVAGSGPTDRDGNNPLGDKANSYKMLAHELDSQDIASFRYDKRGVGNSIPANFNEGDLVFDDYIKDAEKIFNYLHDSLGFKDIYIIGHSEGSLIGMVAAGKTTSKGFISVAGAGRPIDEVLEEQVNAQPLPDSLKNKIASIMAELKIGKEVNNVPPSLNPLFRTSVQPYMISWLQYDPAKEVQKLHCPVLILQGACDKQVKIIDAEKLHEADKKSLMDIIPFMTHTLKNAGADCKDPNNKTYMDPLLPLNKKLVEDIVTFIKKG